MTAAKPLSKKEMARVQNLDAAVLDHIAEIDDHPIYQFHTSATCKVCTSSANDLVNKMLAHAMTYSDILRALKPVNDVLPPNDRVSINSIRNHARKHFPINAAAQAVYRGIVEQRATEAGKDYVMGVNGALTPIAYFDVMMRKGFEALVEDDTVITPDAGLRAAAKLHELTAEQQTVGDVADLMLKLNTLVEAVKTSVPEELWPVILAKIEGREDDVIDAVTVEEPEQTEPPGYDPGDPDLVNDDPESNEDIGHL